MASSQLKKSGVVDESVLHDLGKPSPYFTRAEGRERRGIAEHTPGLVEGADEILAAWKIDAGLAAHRGVHLGEQCGWHLQEIDAALVAGSGESGDIADDPSAERDDDTVACNTPLDQGALNFREGVQRLVALSIRDDVYVDAGCIREGGAKLVEVERSHRLVGDHEDVPVADVRGEQPPLADDAGADVNRVAPGPQVDLDGTAHNASMRWRISLTTKRLDRCVDLTTMSAFSR